MTLLALDIPDGAEEVAAWLAGHLLGPHLGTLVAELEAFQPAPLSAGLGLQEVLGDRLDAVLGEGLRALPPPLLRRLLAQPRLLLELQEMVLLEGGTVWESVGVIGMEIAAQKQRGWQRLLATSALAPPATVPEQPSARIPPGKRRFLPWLLSGAVAAAVVLGVFAGREMFFPGKSVTGNSGEMGSTARRAPGWGWAKPGSLPEQGSAREYLKRLADAGAEWFKQRPEEPAALAQRLGEFRQGCTALLLAEHRPLAPEDRQWLQERCRVWAGKIDQCLATVENGQVRQARTDADTIANRLVAALRKRAETVG